METTIVGFIATSSSVLAFGSQFYHTLQSKTTTGLSVHRTIFDVISLALWVYYAARVEDNPLLIATALELFTSACVCMIFFKKRKTAVLPLPLFEKRYGYSPPPSPLSDPKSSSEDVSIVVTPSRRYSV
jgi:uncharacterized protein with PQ loop repeat